MSAAAVTRLKKLKLARVSLVDDPANEHARLVLFKRAETTKAELNSSSRDDIEDSKFAAVWTDADGKKQRKLPIHDAAHVRNALARFGQTDLPAGVKSKARQKLEAAARKLGIGQENKMAKKPDNEPDEDDVQKGMCPSCDAKVGAGDKYCPNCGEKLPEGAMKSAIDLDKIEDPEVRKQVEQLTADCEAAQALAEEEQTKRIKAEKAAKPPDKDGDEVIKGLPESVRQRIEKAEADAKLANEAIRKMAEEKREQEFIVKARGYKNLSLEPVKFGGLLKRVSDGTATEADGAELHRVLTAASNQAKASLRIVGKASSGADSGEGRAWDQIQSKAKELREEVLKSGDKLSMPEAIDRVCRENSGLYRDYLSENAPGPVGRAAGEEE